MSIYIKTFKLGEDDKINTWMKEREHQLIDKGGPYPLDASGMIWIMYNGDKEKVEAPKEIVKTGPQPEVDMEKARQGQKAAGLIQMLRNDRGSTVEAMIKAEKLLRLLPRQRTAKRGEIDNNKIQEVKQAWKNMKLDIEVGDQLIKDLEDGKLEEILAKDNSQSEIIIAKK